MPVANVIELNTLSFKNAQTTMTVDTAIFIAKFLFVSSAFVHASLAH